MPEKKIRVLIAKPGLDGHDRGAKVIARALRDAGMEVIYTGLRQTPAMIVEAAVQEDVDAIGLLSILSGAHMAIFPKHDGSAARPGRDRCTGDGRAASSRKPTFPALKQAGIAEVFLPGTTTQGIVDFIRQRVAAAPPGSVSGASDRPANGRMTAARRR